MKKGFTLLELIIVIIIIGILATLGFSQYTKMVEKGRTAEARAVLGNLRTLETAYHLEHGVWAVVTASQNDLGVDLPIGQGGPACRSTHYFTYECCNPADLGGGATICKAYRCAVNYNGKTPGAVPASGNTPTFAYYFAIDLSSGTFIGGGIRSQGLY